METSDGTKARALRFVVLVDVMSFFADFAQVVRILWRTHVPAHVVVTLAEHPKWSVRYAVRLALIRTPHSPLASVLRFLPKIMLPDLRDLVRGGTLPAQVREHAKRELARRTGGAR